MIYACFVARASNRKLLLMLAINVVSAKSFISNININYRIKRGKKINSILFEEI